MQTQNGANAGNIGWLGFELSVLRRLKFESVALPLSGEPNLALYLKHLDARVMSNDPAQWAWTKALALVENNCDILTEEDLERHSHVRILTVWSLSSKVCHLRYRGQGRLRLERRRVLLPLR